MTEKEYIKKYIKDRYPAKYEMPLWEKKKRLKQHIFWLKLSYKHYSFIEEVKK